MGLKVPDAVMSFKGSINKARYSNNFASLWKLAASDGAFQWRFDAGMGLEDIAFDGTYVYASGRKSRESKKSDVYCLDQDGVMQWRFNTGDLAHRPRLSLSETAAGTHVWVAGRDGNPGLWRLGTTLVNGIPFSASLQWSEIPAEQIERISEYNATGDWILAVGDASLVGYGSGGEEGAEVANVRIYDPGDYPELPGLLYEFAMFIASDSGIPYQAPLTCGTTYAGGLFSVGGVAAVYLAGDPSTTTLGASLELRYQDGTLGYSFDSGDECYNCRRRDTNGYYYLGGRRSNTWPSASGYATFWLLDDAMAVQWTFDSYDPIKLIVVDESSGDVFIASDTPNDLWAGASGTTANIWRVSETGTVQWSANTGWIITDMRVVSGQLLCTGRRNAQHGTVGTGLASVWVFNATTGALVWSYDTYGDTNAIASDGTDVYVAGVRRQPEGTPQTAPSYIELLSIDGTQYYIFCEDDGTVKIDSARPSVNTDGDEVGLQF